MGLEYRGKSAFPLRLPKSTIHRIKALADAEGISVNQFISLAVTEKIVRVEDQSTNRPASEADASQIPEAEARNFDIE